MAYAEPLRLTGIVAALTLAATASGEAPAAIAAVPTVWPVPYPFGTNVETPSNAGLTLRRPRQRFRAAGPMGSSTQFAKMRWSTWGARTVFGRGRGRQCEKSHCTRYRTVRPTLSGRVTNCTPAVRVYSTYKLSGLPGAFKGRALQSGAFDGC